MFSGRFPIAFGTSWVDSSLHGRQRGRGAAIQRRGDPGEEEKVRRTGGLMVVLLITLALAAPAAAQAPSEGWQGWTWSGVVERLTGWAGGVVGVFAASETGTEEGEGGEETALPTLDPMWQSTEGEPEQGTESFPKTDPDG
jgi:hypothetical protein